MKKRKGTLTIKQIVEMVKKLDKATTCPKHKVKLEYKMDIVDYCPVCEKIEQNKIDKIFQKAKI